MVRKSSGVISAYQVDKEFIDNTIKYDLHIITSDTISRDVELKKLKDEYFYDSETLGWTKEEIRKEWKSIKKKIEERIIFIHPELKFEFTLSEKILWSFLKIAINFAIHSNIPSELISDKINLLRLCLNQCELSPPHCVYWFYPNRFFPDNFIHHTLVLKSDNSTKKLYAIISIFGILNSLVILSENYKGQNIYASYCFNFREECETQFDCEITPNLLQNGIIESINLAKSYFQRNMNWFMSFFKTNDNIGNILVNTLKECMEQMNISGSEIIMHYSELRSLFYDKVCSNKDIRILRRKEVDDCFHLMIKNFLCNFL